MKIPPLRWFWLILFSTLAVVGLESLNLPAALLLGPMAMAIVFAARDKPLIIHRNLFYLAQGVVGSMQMVLGPLIIVASLRTVDG